MAGVAGIQGRVSASCSDALIAVFLSFELSRFEGRFFEVSGVRLNIPRRRKIPNQLRTRATVHSRIQVCREEKNTLGRIVRIFVYDFRHGVLASAMFVVTNWIIRLRIRGHREFTNVKPRTSPVVTTRVFREDEHSARMRMDALGFNPAICPRPLHTSLPSSPSPNGTLFYFLYQEIPPRLPLSVFPSLSCAATRHLPLPIIRPLPFFAFESRRSQAMPFPTCITG